MNMAISSLVVDTMPECTVDVKIALDAMGGVEVHEVQGHKLVVTIEAESADASHAIASSYVAIPGVINVNLVFISIEDELDEDEVEGGASCSVCEEGGLA